MPLHPVVLAAADGRLPDWANVGPDRREHIHRVAKLLGTWAEAAGLSPEDLQRWRAAGTLHDALRDAPAHSLRESVPNEFQDLPDAFLHGPAAAVLLRSAGVTDDELLAAVAFHTMGDASLGPLGRALYAADFLEPGRKSQTEQRSELRSRAAAELDDVVFEVARARIAHCVERGSGLHPCTVAFWNALVAERHE
jgi:2-amino-4-hydroxy-6-hydroxymethyldihydropteridine diphosphokinase